MLNIPELFKSAQRVGSARSWWVHFLTSGGLAACRYARHGALVSTEDAFRRVGLAGALSVASILAHLLAKLAQVTGQGDAEGDQGAALDPDEPISSYGIDSMTATELSMYLRSNYNFVVSTVELMTSASCRSLAEAVVKQHTGESVCV